MYFTLNMLIRVFNLVDEEEDGDEQDTVFETLKVKILTLVI
jgi:hypothetical protein